MGSLTESLKGEHTKKQQEMEAKLVKMMTSVVIVFTLCNGFESMVFILASLDQIELVTVQMYLRPLADLLMVINSSVNLAIYCGFNTEFREKFVELYLSCELCKKPKSRNPV